MEKLVDYYENNHAALGATVWNQTGKFPKRYVRRYFRPITFGAASEVTERATEAPFDLAMELWFDSREDCEEFFKRGSAAPHAELFAEDEMKFLDRDKTLAFVLEEHETDLSANRNN